MSLGIEAEKVGGNSEPPIKCQSSGPNKVSEDAKQGAERLTAPVARRALPDLSRKAFSLQPSAYPGSY